MARKTPGINTGSMADISFLLLTFFLLTSSINTEQGIPRRLPPPKENTEEIKIDINQRNVLDVRVNFRDELVVNDEIVPLSQLTLKAKEFLENVENSPNLPEKESKYIDNIGEFYVSKGVISLTNDQSTSYSGYVMVQNELQRAVNELRDKISTQYFGKRYDNLDTAQQAAIRKAVPMNISEAPPVDYNQQPAQ
ncbi:MAG: biopolymer transporter ExbD [Bacteroidales bacterium]|jgi:biopolymer transport protein ExbD|nr:biopolymer transporter ExbD [Bacteroidales bacterium]